MEDLILEASKYTPQIEFLVQTRQLNISGESYPENTAEFYNPVFSWLNEFLTNNDNRPITVNFNIQYFNSSTSKVFMDLIDFLDNQAEKGTAITINWEYLEEDENMAEYGEEFQEDVKYLSFNLIPITP